MEFNLWDSIRIPYHINLYLRTYHNQSDNFQIIWVKNPSKKIFYYLNYWNLISAENLNFYLYLLIPSENRQIFFISFNSMKYNNKDGITIIYLNTIIIFFIQKKKINEFRIAIVLKLPIRKCSKNLSNNSLRRWHKGLECRSYRRWWSKGKALINN